MADDQNPQLPLDGDPSRRHESHSHQHRRGDAPLLSRLLHVGHHRPRAARRPRRPQARASPRPLRHEEMGLQYNKKYTKCAKVVGQAMGIYHPHGDSAIYDTLVRMAQPFSLRYPLVDGQGNFGSVDGDPPAAMRYTECRMVRIAGEMLADIDWKPSTSCPTMTSPPSSPRSCPRVSPTSSSTAQRHRRRHGHEHSAAQPHRGRQRRHRAGQEIPKPASLMVLKHVQGSGLPHRRLSSTAAAARADLQDRPRPLPHARQCGHRKRHQGTPGHHRHRDSLPGQQIQRSSSASPSWSQNKIITDIDIGADVARRERPRRHAHRHRAQARRAA